MNRIKKEKKSVEQLSADFFAYQNYLKKKGLYSYGIPLIHVAGTNGKGTVCKILGDIYTQAGLKVGVFTSPHLISVTERLKINGIEISEKEFQKYENGIKKEEEQEGFQENYFRRLTTTALSYFKEEGCDLVILETGLGGRWDSTNALSPEDLLVSVITKIGYDHTQLLGNSLREIAGEKGGIIKPGVPVITCSQEEEALSVLEKIADESSSPLYIVEEPKTVIMKGGLRVIPEEKIFGRHDYDISLMGNYQGMNSLLALKTAELLSPDFCRLSSEKVFYILKHLQWPGRMDFYVDDSGREYLLEGAHNLPGIQKLSEFLSESSYQKVHIIPAILKDKDYKGMIRELSGSSRYFYFTDTGIPGMTSPDELMALVRGKYCPDVKEALREIYKTYSRGDLILFTGSLYFIGEIMKNIHKNSLKLTKKGYIRNGEHLSYNR